MKRVVLALGGNVGDVPNVFGVVLKYLQDLGALENISRSRTYRSRSLLKDGQPDYYNCVCASYTPLSPSDLLRLLKETELLFGRQNQEQRWRERTIDIDIIDYGASIVREDNLVIPHPQMASRSFVLFPMKEVDPTYINPESGLTIKQMCCALEDNLNIMVV